MEKRLYFTNDATFFVLEWVFFQELQLPVCSQRVVLEEVNQEEIPSFPRLRLLLKTQVEEIL